MNKELYVGFDPLDPLDNMIMTDPELDNVVAEVESYIDNCAKGNDFAIQEFANDIVDEDDDFDDFVDDDDTVDMASDVAGEDAEDYSAAEMELLSGDFGENDAVDSVDGIEFTGMD
jgi:hypothetical protein